MRSRFYKGLGHHGFHRLHYLEWGDHDNPRTLVCVHGLTRNARDFDRFAQVLAEHYRVVCVDVAGRGLSDRLAVPQDYGYPLYLQDMESQKPAWKNSWHAWMWSSATGSVPPWGD